MQYRPFEMQCDGRLLRVSSETCQQESHLLWMTEVLWLTLLLGKKRPLSAGIPQLLVCRKFSSGVCCRVQLRCQGQQRQFRYDRYSSLDTFGFFGFKL